MSWSEIQQYLHLPKLIKERKEEKQASVKQKVRHDLKVIADRRKYKEDLEPIPDGAFERFEREHIWDEVLKYITDPSDITSAYFACVSFANILEERRKLMLLPEALRILLEGSLCRDEDSLVSKLDILPIRGTCKSWKKIADREVFESQLDGESWYNDLEEIPEAMDCEEDVCIFRNAKSVEKAFAVLSSERGKDSPMVRKLYVDRSEIREGLEMNLFRGKVLQFLEFHGNSVWLFVYEGSMKMSDYEHLWHMLEKMPNLKALTLKRILKSENMCLQEEEIMIENMLVRMPFPILDCLKYLRFGGHDNKQWMAHVYRRCPNLKSVIHARVGLPGDEVSMALDTLCLERLVGPVEPFLFSPNKRWPLKVLDIRNMYMSLPFQRFILWPLLNQFHGTLEDFKLDYDVLEDAPFVPLNLPRLKFLKLCNIAKRTIGFDDLLPLKSLENLIINSYEDNRRPKDKNALIKIYGIQEEMERSNIWACFPNLMKLEFTNGGCGYIRHGSSLSQFKICGNDEDDDEEGEWILEKVHQICAE